MPAPTPITFLITDLHLGGTPLLLRDLALALRSHNFAPTIISLKPLPAEGTKAQRHKGTKAKEGEPLNAPAPSVPQCLSASVPSLTIPQQLRAQNVPVHSLNLTSARSTPRATHQLIQLLKRLQPSVLYSMLIHANALASAAIPFLSPRPKFIQSLHTLQPNPRWHWTLQGLLAPLADALIVPAQPILDTIARHGNFQRGTVIPNGIDIDRFAHASPMPPDSLPWPPNTPVIGYLGRFDPVKNLPLLLRAFARIHPPQIPIFREAGVGATASDFQKNPLPQPIPHLVLVGYGPQETELRNLATSLHIAPRVHFPGPTTTPERWLKSFSIMCLPSAVEGFGLTLLEALAAGTPIVALETPVAQSILRPQDATLLPIPVSDSSLAISLQAVIAKFPHTPLSPTEAPNSTLSYLRSTFSITRMAELHAEFFRNLLATRH